MNLDPLLSLALNMHSSKGVYALLIGSGVSRSAQIPTGWEVVLDLIRKLLKLRGADCESDPAAWFRAEFHEEPDYAKLLDQLTTSPDQRQQLLRGYFEPTDEERADGLKQPTPAHKAIARLVADGHVRVILTTNFDRLLETAILEAGVTPTVLSSPDAFAGAVPLAHQRCVVVKLHGDYLDTRVKNTPAELDAYAPAVDAWLDRVFDEFGLVVAGWSGEWDTALKRALERCPTRRFGFWWASVGDPRPTATGLAGLRGGQIVRCAGADQFFQGLADKVSVLDDVYPEHPVNVAAGVALVKRFLGEPRQPIRLADLIAREADRAQAELAKEQEAFLNVQGDQSRYAPLMNRYLAMTATTRALVANAGFWGRGAVLPSISRAIVRVAHDPAVAVRRSGLVLNDCFRLPPGVAVLYAACLGLVAADEFVAAADLMLQTKVFERNEVKTTLVEQFQMAFDQIRIFTNAMPGRDRQFLPFNELLFDTLRPETAGFFPDPAAYEIAFAHVELLMALVTGHIGNAKNATPEKLWTTPGRFMYRGGQPRDPLFYAQDQGDEVAWCKQQTPFLELIASGKFGGEWTRLVTIRKAIAVNARQWTRGY